MRTAGVGAAVPTTSGVLSAGMLLKGRYEIKRLLGAGGMGRAYEALDTLDDTRCVVKELLNNYSDQTARDEAARLFKKEAQILRELFRKQRREEIHNHLPEVTNYFAEDNQFYLVMEYIPGRNLSDELARHKGKGIGEKQVRQWLCQILPVLDYLHSQNPPIIHRDIKPQNLRLEPDGTVVLMDFGIARRYSPTKTSDTERFGDPAYIPPEQWSRQTDARSDLFSLGATAYHLLTGAPPRRQTPMSEYEPIQAHCPGLSQELANVIQKATDLVPDQRCQSAQEMLEALNQGQAPPTAPMPELPAQLWHKVQVVLALALSWARAVQWPRGPVLWGVALGLLGAVLGRSPLGTGLLAALAVLTPFLQPLGLIALLVGAGLWVGQGVLPRGLIVGGLLAFVLDVALRFGLGHVPVPLAVLSGAAFLALPPVALQRHWRLPPVALAGVVAAWALAPLGLLHWELGRPAPVLAEAVISSSAYTNPNPRGRQSSATPAPPSQAADGEPGTSWVSADTSAVDLAADGDQGLWIEFPLAAPLWISRISLLSGWSTGVSLPGASVSSASGGRWEDFARPQRVHLEFYLGPEEVSRTSELALRDDPGLQSYLFQPVVADRVRLRIRQVYPGVQRLVALRDVRFDGQAPWYRRVPPALLATFTLRMPEPEAPRRLYWGTAPVHLDQVRAAPKERDPEGEQTYLARNAVDGDPQTVWASDILANGELCMLFATARRISALEIRTGFPDSRPARLPTDVTLWFSDRTRVRLTLAASSRLQRRSFAPVVTSEVCLRFNRPTALSGSRPGPGVRLPVVIAEVAFSDPSPLPWLAGWVPQMVDSLKQAPASLWHSFSSLFQTLAREPGTLGE